MDIAKINKLLKSGNNEEQIEALNYLVDLYTTTNDLVIECLEKANDRLFISERIYLLEGMLSKKLVDKFENTNEVDLRLNIALILFKQDSHYCQFRDYLLEVFQNYSWEFGQAALFKLRQANVKEVIPLVTKKLENTDLSNVNQLEMFIDTLNHFNVPLPDDIRNKLNCEDIPLRIKAALINSK